MSTSETLQRQLEHLNEDQRRAAETIDGPLLVIAGPGTGKTQLLSVRAANILANRDVSPENVLCLTYTEAGAEAMKKRLVELVGRDGYGVEVYTFHGFANRLRNLYPEHFDTSSTALLATPLMRGKLVNDILSQLPPSNPLYARARGHVKANVNEVMGAIDKLKLMGITPDELRAIARQNLAGAAYLEERSEVLGYLQVPVPRAKGEKLAFMEAFEQAVAVAVEVAPAELKRPVVDVPGIYQPYLLWVDALVRDTELLEGNKSTGYANVKKQLFKKDEGLAAKARAVRALELADVLEAYRENMRRQDLIDYQDMINHAIEAMERNPSFREELQERFRYLQVDEFQDTNGSQMRIVSLLCQGLERPNVMAVGDDDQAIMRFQGASVEGIRQFRSRYRPTEVVLKTNYRSTPSLVELGQRVAGQITNRLVEGEDKAIVAAATVDEQESFESQRFETREIQYDAVARSLRERLDEGFVDAAEDPEEAIAVIASKHESLRGLIPYLRAYDVPFTYKVRSRVTNIESLQTLLALFRCVCLLSEGDRDRAEALLPSIVAAPELGLSPRECVEFAITARRSPDGWLGSLATSGRPKLVKLGEDLIQWASEAQTAPVRELMHRIATPIKVYHEAHADDDPLAMAEFQAGLRALLDETAAEIEFATRSHSAVRLPQVMRTLDEMEDYQVDIDASVPLGRPDAVTLTTAHSSKGLEFDLVYLLDVDDATWHPSKGSGSLLPKNILTGTDRDDDDMVRLLFVAITRAKRLLQLSSAKDNLVRELQGVVDEVPMEVDPESIANVIEVAWEDSYALDTPELLTLLRRNLTPRSLSASALNAFVTYEKGCVNSSSYPAKRMLRLPGPPSESLDFGIVVHGFLQDYVEKVLVKGEAAEPLIDHHRERVQWLDYPKNQVQNLVNRFDAIVEGFVPTLEGRIAGNVRPECEVAAVTDSGVPIYGKCDLLLIDRDAKTLTVLDYKTGRAPTSRPDRNYLRQLQFYKVLLESSPDFEGYRVVEAQDLYVEPLVRTESELADPVRCLPTTEEAGHLDRLIEVVWKRIQEGRFDTSDFEESEAYLHFMEKKPRSYKEPLQELYEEWLIATG